MPSASGISGLNGQTVHSNVTSVNELELAGVGHRVPETMKKHVRQRTVCEKIVLVSEQENIDTVR